jgi:hypothetical protein
MKRLPRLKTNVAIDVWDPSGISSVLKTEERKTPHEAGLSQGPEVEATEPHQKDAPRGASRAQRYPSSALETNFDFVNGVFQNKKTRHFWQWTANSLSHIQWLGVQ